MDILVLLENSNGAIHTALADIPLKTLEDLK